MAASEKTSKLPDASVSLMVVVILCLIYVISPGPVMFMLTKMDFGSSPNLGSALSIFYAPLEWAYVHWEPAHRFFDAYFKFLGVR